MTWFVSLVTSSIGKKQVMAVSGLLLCAFLVAHLAGNCLLFVGKDAFNAYADALASNAFVFYGGEVILLSIFAIHIGMACKLTLENRKARPDRYVVNGSRGTRTVASANMFVTGLIVLVFLVVHLINFRFADKESTTLYDIVLQHFQSLGYVVYYCLSSTVLAVHVWHGFQSAFRSLGIEHVKCTPILRGIGKIFAVVVAVGYSSLAIWLYVQGGN